MSERDGGSHSVTHYKVYSIRDITLQKLLLLLSLLTWDADAESWISNWAQKPCGNGSPPSVILNGSLINEGEDVK